MTSQIEYPYSGNRHQNILNNDVENIVESLKDCFIKIKNKISYNNPLNLGSVISTNASNDEVKQLDIISNEFIIEELLKNRLVKTISSEENEDLIKANENGKYFVSFDPLDGSSNISSNITIGTIFAIYIDNNIQNKTLGESIVAAGYCLYGGSTQLVYSVKNNINPIVSLSILNNTNTFIKVGNLKIPPKGKVYAINESNKHSWLHPMYKKLTNYFIESNYTQRWVGSLVADAHRTIIKGGFFCYPSDKEKIGALRLLYEAIPFCFIFENAGGRAYIGDDLDDWRLCGFPCGNTHRKTPLLLMGQQESEVISLLQSELSKY